jgi:hypothetical protein
MYHISIGWRYDNSREERPPTLDNVTRVGGERARGGRVSLPLAYRKIFEAMW